MIMPHYAATLAQICQLGLHMGRQSFHNAMLKHQVFDRSIEAALGALEVHLGSITCFAFHSWMCSSHLHVLTTHLPGSSPWCCDKPTNDLLSAA